MGFIPVEQVARRAGLPLPVEDPDVEATLNEAVEEALAEVAAHLRCSPILETYTERGVTDDGHGGWLLDRDPVEVLTVTPEAANGVLTGRYTIVYRAGLNPDQDPRYGRVLRRYVAWAAAQNPMVRRLAQTVPGARIQASVNVEGQGVTWESTQTRAGAVPAGTPPTLSDLDEWVELAVYQRPGRGRHPLADGTAWL